MSLTRRIDSSIRNTMYFIIDCLRNITRQKFLLVLTCRLRDLYLHISVSAKPGK